MVNYILVGLVAFLIGNVVGVASCKDQVNKYKKHVRCLIDYFQENRNVKILILDFED